MGDEAIRAPCPWKMYGAFARLWGREPAQLGRVGPGSRSKPPYAIFAERPLAFKSTEHHPFLDQRKGWLRFVANRVEVEGTRAGSQVHPSARNRGNFDERDAEHAMTEAIAMEDTTRRPEDPFGTRTRDQAGATRRWPSLARVLRRVATDDSLSAFLAYARMIRRANGRCHHRKTEGFSAPLPTAVWSRPGSAASDSGRNQEVAIVARRSQEARYLL